MTMTGNNLIYSTVLIFCQLNTMAAALPSRFSRKKTFLFMNLVGAVLLGLCALLSVLLDAETAIAIFGELYVFPQIAAGLFISRYRKGRFWCIFFACDVSSVLCSTGAYTLGSLFFSYNQANLGMLIFRTGGVVLGTVYAVFFLIPKFKNLMDTKGVPWGSLALAVGMMEVMIMVMSTSPALIFLRPEERFNLLGVCVGSGVVLSMLVISLNRVKLAADESRAASERAGVLEGQLALSERYYTDLTTQLQQNRMQVHDLRHHINTLGGLCREGDLEGIRAYVASMETMTPPAEVRQYCASSPVNALLAYYDALCREAGIEFSCDLRLPPLEKVDPLHLCLIFGNALQNALEAIGHLPQSAERYLRVRGAKTGDKLVLSVENPFSGELQLRPDGLPETNKQEPGHGLGLASIRQTAERYGGWGGGQAEGGIFTLQAVLRG